MDGKKMPQARRKKIGCESDSVAKKFLARTSGISRRRRQRAREPRWIGGPPPATLVRMMEMEVVQCPFCGQQFELAVDVSVPSQRFVTDCEICCRPFEVIAECEAGEILSLDVVGS